jgi:hypothetical protein
VEKLKEIKVTTLNRNKIFKTSKYVPGGTSELKSKKIALVLIENPSSYLSSR